MNLVEAVVIGSNLTGDVSQCKLTKLITMVDTLAVEDTILKALTTDREIDQYLSGDEFSAYQLVNLLYPEYKSRTSAAELDELFEICDRLQVIAHGKLSPSIAAGQATVAQMGEWMSGLWEAHP